MKFKFQVLSQSNFVLHTVNMNGAIIIANID
jgi:hypothetical protein